MSNRLVMLNDSRFHQFARRKSRKIPGRSKSNHGQRASALPQCLRAPLHRTSEIGLYYAYCSPISRPTTIGISAFGTIMTDHERRRPGLAAVLKKFRRDSCAVAAVGARMRSKARFSGWLRRQALLQTNATMNVDIEGHTDNAGDDAYNLSLSAPLAKRGCVAGAEWRRAREAQRRWTRGACASREQRYGGRASPEPPR